MAYEARSHYKYQREVMKEPWIPRRDETILGHAVAFLELLHNKETDFVPTHSEDYCFAYAFGLTDEEEGKERWPSIETHESNRLEEMKKTVKEVNAGEAVTSRDHRPIYSGAMLQMLNGMPLKIKHPVEVRKSWPEFYEFLEDSPKILQTISIP